LQNGFLFLFYNTVFVVVRACKFFQ
jgi:hypothetical protein